MNKLARGTQKAYGGVWWLLAVTLATIAPAADPETIAVDGQQHSASALLQSYCIDCHGASEPEADVRLDGLVTTNASDVDGRLLLRAFEVIASRQMPPAEAESLTDKDREQLQSWLADQLQTHAQASRRMGRWSRNRRLTVAEYNFTMQSLFGVPAQFADMLLPDPISNTGFNNDSQLLGISSLHVESYLDSARRAIDRYINSDTSKLPKLRYHIEFEDLYYFTADRYGSLERAPQPLEAVEFDRRQEINAQAEPVYVAPLTPRLAGARSDDEALRAAIPKMHQQFVALPQWISTGELVLRLRAAGTPDRDGRYPRLRVEAGITLGDGCSVDKRILGEVDVLAPLHEPETYEFRFRIEDLPTKGPLRPQEVFDQLSVFDMNQIFISNVSCDAAAVLTLGRGGYSDPLKGDKQLAAPLQRMRAAGVNLLYLDSLAVEMLPMQSSPSAVEWSAPAFEGLSVDEQNTLAEQFLHRFMQAAYRRPVTIAELDIKRQLFQALRSEGYAVAESLRETLASVLVSPSFLFIESPLAAEAPTPYQLASRLSYFLWLSPPDAELLQRAADGSLRQGDVWRSQAERLLDDPRSGRFLDNFCRHWLRLDKLANVPVDHDAYPTYDEDLSLLSYRETLEYFAELFKSNTSALDLLSSDYRLVNDRLADHYGLDPILTGDLRKVQLPAGSVRGGLLTQASVLTMNSDGVDSHPIRRGVWLLDRLLNAPPLPPPPNVPALEVTAREARGLSLRDRIELHRQPGGCQSCHKKIDPWGLALENFDATGRWREAVAQAGDERAPPQPVESSVELPDGTRLDGVSGLQQYLLAERHEQFTRAVVYHMLTYALGRPLDFADRPQLDLLHQRFAQADYRLRALVLAVVESAVFRE